MAQIIGTILAATFLGVLCTKAKVPGGMLVGGVLGAGILSIFTGLAYMPLEGKILAQSLAGTFIGTTIERHHLKQLKSMIKPAFIVLSVHFIVNMIAGFAIYQSSPLDFKTAFLGAVPGGLNDIPLIAADMGADSPKVLALQMVRNLSGIGLFPSMILHITPPDSTLTVVAENLPSTKPGGNIFLTLLIGLLFGVIGFFTPVPAGTLLISMLAVLAFQLVFQKAYLPLWCKRIAQLLSGAYIGSSMLLEDVKELKYLLLPIGIVLIGYTAACFIIGFLLHKFAGMSLRKGMLLGIPGGASDMALIGSDLGVESPDLVVIQIIRLVVVVAIFPQVIDRLAAFVP